MSDYATLNSSIWRMPRWTSATGPHLTLIGVLIIIVLAPGLGGFWGRDDFGCLATVRMIGSPWVLFTQDHYPVAHSIFRPMGYFAMWLCVKVFGVSYAPHAAFDLAMHIGVAIALRTLLARNGIAAGLATLAALAFALHPTVAGPVLWWSAKFDLLATFFILVSLNAAFRFRDRQTTSALIVTLSAGLAAMLSKEIGTIAVAGATVIWLMWMFEAPLQRRAAISGIVLSWLSALVYLGWRGWVLQSFSSGITGSLSMHDAFAKGIASWATQAVGYLTFFPRLTPVESIVLLACGAAIGVALIAGYVDAKNRKSRLRLDLLLVGLCLFGCPIIIQAPITAFATPLNDGFSAVEAAMQSRLYYLQIVGIVIVVATLLQPIWESRQTIRRLVAASFVLMVTTLACASHSDASAFANRSTEIAGMAREAVAAVTSLQPPAMQCHIVFLGYEPPPEWSIVVSMDSIVKGIAPNLGQLRHCWIHSDVRTSFHVQPAKMPFDAAKPFSPLATDSSVMSWPQAGRLEFAYLARLDDSALRGDPNTIFFLHRGDKFVDVTSEVASGRVPADDEMD